MLKSTVFNFSNFVLGCVDLWLLSVVIRFEKSSTFLLKALFGGSLPYNAPLYNIPVFIFVLGCSQYLVVTESMWTLFYMSPEEEFLGYIFGSGLGFYQVILRAMREIVIEVFTNFTTFLLDYSKCRLLKAYNSFCLQSTRSTSYYLL